MVRLGRWQVNRNGNIIKKWHPSGAFFVRISATPKRLPNSTISEMELLEEVTRLLSPSVHSTIVSLPMDFTTWVGKHLSASLDSPKSIYYKWHWRNCVDIVTPTAAICESLLGERGQPPVRKQSRKRVQVEGAGVCVGVPSPEIGNLPPANDGDIAPPRQA